MNRMMILLVALCLTVPVIAQERPVGNWIADEAKLLQPNETQEILNQIHQAEQATGIRLAVVTLPSITTEPKTVAVETITRWQLGPKSVLLLVSLSPRKVYIQPGNQFAEVLTEQVCVDICLKHIVPQLKEQHWSTGISNGLQAIQNQLNPPAEATQPSTSGTVTESNYSWFYWLLGGLSGLVSVYCLYRYFNSESPHSSRPTYTPTTYPRTTSESRPRRSTGGGGGYTRRSSGGSSGGSSGSSSGGSSSSFDYGSSSYDSGPSSSSSSYDSGGSSSFDCGGGGGGGSDF